MYGWRPEMDEDLKMHRQLFLSDLLISSELRSKYTQLKTDEERFKLVLDIIVQHSSTLFDSECEHKISKHSLRMRANGNNRFIYHDYYVALQLYTDSIMYAVDSSEELALAYGNRSAALFELKKYEDCIADIDRALNLKYPDKLKTKLYKRKGLSFQALGKTDADSLFREALVWLDKMNLGKDVMDDIKREIDQLISAPNTTPEPTVKLNTNPLPKILTPNPEIPCASEAVALKCSKELGPHIVAARNIKPGELLILEKPYCMKLLPKYAMTYCEYCLQVSWALIPCKYCPYAGYCSETCKDKAWNKYHEMECPVVGILRYFDVSDALWVSMRMTLMATQKGTNLNTVKEELNDVELNTDPRTKGFSNDTKLHSDQYRSICSLGDNANKLGPMEMLYERLWSALTICALARETNLFGKKLVLDATLTTNPDVLFVGALMLKHIHICWSMTHTYGASYRSNAYKHGQALMAVRGRINHSCDPNTISQWYGDHMAIYAAYPIQEGEEIFNTNGLRYIVMTKGERTEYFRGKNIVCKCVPCTESWPLLSHIPSYKKQKLARQIKLKLNKILSKTAIKINVLRKNRALENVPQMIDEVVNLIQELHKVVTRPCAELAMAAVMLSDLYASGDSVFDYVPLKFSAIETQCEAFYYYLQFALSKH